MALLAKAARRLPGPEVALVRFLSGVGSVGIAAQPGMTWSLRYVRAARRLLRWIA